MIISFILLYPQIPEVAVASRGIEPILITNSQGQQVGLYKKSYALVIGACQYTNGWPRLSGVMEDVKLVTGILEEHGFKVDVVNDPDHAQLNDAFRNFIKKYGRKKENRLLFYFAGHGHTLKHSYGEEMGYIVPVDAPNPNQDLDGFMDKAMDMQMIEVFAKRIQSKHALFLFDSCFSGSIFAMSRAVPENISYKTSRPVRQFITSGGAEEQVPDISTFRQQFVSALKGEGDTDDDGYLTGTELGEFLQSKVVNYTKGAQHPQYGKIRNPNLDKGDFVFALKVEPFKPAKPIIAIPPNVEDNDNYYESIASERKRAMTMWKNWQSNMLKRYSGNHVMDKGNSLIPSEKAQMWKGFLSKYSNDNPHSMEDQLMRSKAKARLNYWKNYKAPKPAKEKQAVIIHKPAKKEPTVIIRNKPTSDEPASINLRSSFRNLSMDQAQSMSKMSINGKKDWGFYGYCTVNHSYKKSSINGDKVVIDHTTGLMWHQSGSDKYMKLNDANGWIKSLNSRGYAGYNDWRLPTVEEAASLLEADEKNNLHIDPVFSENQLGIWTGDEYDSENAWFVGFSFSDVFWYNVSNEGHVRPVRSIK